MSKEILEQIKKLPQNERIALQKQLAELNAYDTNHASQGIDPGTGYWDDYIKKEYDQPKQEGNPDLRRTNVTITPEKQKTGEHLPGGPVTDEQVKTGEADKIKKEGND
jgi:hypothetical protein